MLRWQEELPVRMERRAGTDQLEPSLKQDSPGTSHNTDLSLLTLLATANSRGEILPASVRPFAGLDPPCSTGTPSFLLVASQ